MVGAPRSIPGLAAAMAVAMGAGPLIVYSISTLSPFLVPALDLTRTQYGSLATLTSVQRHSPRCEQAGSWTPAGPTW